ncbi:MAG: 23S rRNA (uracil(1939)-C(5))-methyltransferase RlmD [bacterium]
MNTDGAAIAPTGAQRVSVPFGIPGEEALVEIVRGGSRPEGKILTLLRKSPQTATPPCRHFGVCGGCQWQHLSYGAQLEYKSYLVREQLMPVLDGVSALIRPTIGAAPWEYRSRLQAAFGMRGDKVVAGYYAAADDLRIINVRECPIQHAENVRALTAARDVLAGLDWPVYDRVSQRGLIRGIIAQTAFATGEIMVVLSASREIPDRMALVRAMRERVPALVSLMLSIQPRHTPDLLGRLSLLWGRDHLEDEIAGVHVRSYPRAAAPPNPRALPAWLEAISTALSPSASDVVLDTACEEGLVPIALAPRVRRAVGIAPDREAMHHAWENARLNGVDNCVFYTRAPASVLAKLVARGERIDAAIVTARGGAVPPPLLADIADAGAKRLVCAGSSLSLLAADLRAARQAGFTVRSVQPVDLLPQTSKVHCVVSLDRNG